MSPTVTTQQPSTRRRLLRGLLVAQLSASVAAIGWVVACAEGEPTEAQEGDAAAKDAGRDAAEAAAVDGGNRPCSSDICPVEVNLDSRAALYAIWGSAANDVWAAGARGTVAHFDGTAWKASSLGIPNAIFTIWGSSSTDVYLASTSRRLFHTSGWADGGASYMPAGWTSEEENKGGIYEGRVWSIWGEGRGKVVAVGEALRGFRYTNPQQTEFYEYTISLRSLEPAPDAGRADAGKADGGAAGSLWRPLECRDDTSSGGRKADCYDMNVRGVWGSSVSDLVVVGEGGALRRVGGMTPGGDGSEVYWSNIPTGTKANLTAIWGTSTSSFLVVGDRGTLLRSDGYTSTAVELGTKENLQAIWGSGPSDIWVVGSGSTVFHYDGLTWVRQPVDDRRGDIDLFGVWGTAGGDVWIVGDGALLRRPRKG